MSAPSAFDYAIIRVIPRLDRGERINAGVIVYCRLASFLEAELCLERARLSAVAPTLDAGQLSLIEAHLLSVKRICRGGPDAGPIGALSQAERFHWLVAPRSTVIQMSEVHSGLCEHPEATLTRLMRTLVLP